MPRRNRVPRPIASARARSPVSPLRARPPPISHAMSLRFFGRLLPSSVALVYVGQFYRLACSLLLHSLRQLAHPSSLLFVGRSDEQGEQVPQSVHHRVYLRALLVLFVSVIAAPSATLRGGAFMRACLVGAPTPLPASHLDRGGRRSRTSLR